VITENESSAELILGLHRATHATLHALSARFAALGLTASEINALANLADGRALSVSALASATATKPTTLTSVLDRLVRRGYVTRELDPADRRSFRVTLTPAGQPVADAVHAAIRALGNRAFALVSDADKAGVHAVVRALLEVSR
jgi:MarR family transcriptional regulator, organic hydroperoxide resistance regulator